MSMYEIGKFIVYKFTVHYIVYSKLLLLTSLVYSTLDSLQQIVGTYNFVTDQSLSYYTCTVDSLFFNQSESYYTFSLLMVCFSTNQRAITLFHCWWSVFQPIRELLHFFTVDGLFFNQSESYYTFCTVYMYKKITIWHVVNGA